MKPFLGGCVLVASVMLTAGWLWGEGSKKQPAGPAVTRARIAVVDVNYIVNNHRKYKALQEELGETARSYAKKEQSLVEQANALRKNLNDVLPMLSDLEIQAARKQIKEAERKIAANRAAAKTATERLTEEKLPTLYKEIEKAVGHYAAAHDIDLVLHYNVPGKGLVGPRDITRLLLVEGCLPLYAAPGVDITKDVMAAVNRK